MDENQQWFYLEGQEQRGPFEAAVMGQLYHAGVITPETMVASFGSESWIAAGDVFGNIVEATPQGEVRSRSDEAKAVSNWNGYLLLILAIIPVWMFFSILYHGSVEVFDYTTPNPESDRFQVGPMKDSLTRLALMTGVPALLLGVLQRRRFKVKHVDGSATRKVTIWILAGWLAIALICTFAALMTDAPRYIYQLAHFYMKGAPLDSEVLVFTVLLLAVIGIATIVAEQARKVLRKARKRKLVPGFPVFAARNVCIVASLLSLLTLLRAGSWMAWSWPPEKIGLNKAADSTIKAIADFQVKHDGTLGDEWEKLIPDVSAFESSGPFDPDSANYRRRDNDGDHVGTLGVKLITLLSESEEFTSSTRQSDLLDMGFHVIVDGNGDGELRLNETTIQGRALIHSWGWNERNDNGGGDDVLRVLK